MVPLTQDYTENDQAVSPINPYIEGVQLIKLLRQLGLTPNEIRHVEDIKPCFQFVTPQQRIVMSENDTEWLTEFQREFAQFSNEQRRQWLDMTYYCNKRSHHVVDLLQSLPKFPLSSFTEKIKYRHSMQQLRNLNNGNDYNDVAQHEFWQLFTRATSLMLNHAAPGGQIDPVLFERILHVSRWGSGQSQALAEILQQQLAKRGAIFLNRGRLKRLRCKGRKVLQLSVDGGELAEISFRTLIFTSYPHDLLPLVDRETNWQPLIDWLDDQTIAFDRYVLPVPIIKEGLPVGLERRCISVADANQALCSSNLLQIDVHSSCPLQDNTIEGNDNVVLWVKFLVEHGRAVDRQLIEDIYDKLERVVPFARQNQLVAEAEEFVKPLRQGFVYQNRGNFSGAYSGIGPTTPYKNLLVCGPAHLPHFGFEGEMLSAQKTAHLALTQVLGGNRQQLSLARS